MTRFRDSCLRLFRCVLLLAAMTFSASSLAQGLPTGFSRACQYSSMSTPAKLIWTSTFQSYYGVLLINTPIPVQDTLWALESFTADYGEFRYFLAAWSFHYKWGWLFRAIPAPYNAQNVLANNRWAATSVRAGQRSDVELNGTTGFFEVLTPEAYQVLGAHYAVAIFTGTFYFLGTTAAHNCNCTNWGLQQNPNALSDLVCALL